MSKTLKFQSALKIDDELLKRRPIELPGWKLGYRRATPIGKPTIEETENAMVFAEAMHDSSPFWRHDIVAYVDGQTEWGEKGSQIASATGLSTGSAYNMASALRRVAQPERELAPSFSHVEIAARLSPTDQRKWLKKAREEGWNKREFRMEIQAHEKRKKITGTADLEGMFRVWSIDCPWIYAQAQPSGVSAQSRYPGMTVGQLIRMGPSIQAHCTKQAVAFFWVTAPMLYHATEPEKGPDPYRVILAWGFKPKTGGVWDKVKHNFGHYLSIRHEHVIIATRGSCTPDRPTPMIDSVFTERASDVHSRKPECVFKAIEKMYDGNRVEMFATQLRKGWTCYGNQIAAEPIPA